MRLLLALVSLGLTFSSLLTPAASAAGEPSIYWGAKIPGAPFDMTAVNTFESHAGKKMSMIEWGQAWTSGGHFQPFQTSAFDRARGAGLVPLLTWGSWDTSRETVTSPNYQLADIIGGKYDAGVTAWAQQAKAWGHPLLLRFDHEMNGWWYPWSEQTNGNTSGQYVRMWRHVHDIFTRVGANNVSWVWCPNIVGRNSTPMSELYPGDSYVDWSCFDGYNWGTVKGGWQPFDQIMTGSAAFTGGHNTYQELLRTAGSKPIIIGETASVEQGGSKAAWITDMLSDLATKYPRVKGIIWTNVVEDRAGWPIESSASAESAFRKGIASSAYASNEYSTISGKVRPLSGSTTSAPAAAPATVTASSSSVTLVAEDDTYIASATPRTVEGASHTLRANIAGSDTTFMRFDLSRLAGKTITSAKLKVHTASESYAGSGAVFDVNVVTSDQWSESMTFANRVAVSGPRLGTLSGATSPNHAYSINLDLNALKSAGQTVSLAIRGRTTDVILIDSRESGAATAPSMVITYK